MKKFYQTITAGHPQGNCHQYAVASLLEINPEDVPHFSNAKNWRKDYVDFLLTQGLGVLFVPIESDQHLTKFLARNQFMESHVLIAVDSFHHTCQHLIVGEINNGEISFMFDPNPNNSERSSIEEYNIREIHILIDQRSFSSVVQRMVAGGLDA